MTGSPIDTLAAPNFDTPDTNFDCIKRSSPAQPKEDRFLTIFNRIIKDLADGRAIHRKIKTNDFFKDYQDLFEEELDQEGAIHLCRTMNLETFYENQQVYTKGQPTNDKVFLIYSGELEAFTTIEPPSYDLKQSNFNNQPSSRQGSPQPRAKSIKGLSIHAPSRPIPEGEYFGNESLENEPERTETVVVQSAQAQLLVFKAQDFEFVKQRYQKEMANKLNIAAKYFTPTHQKEADIKTKLFHSLQEKILPLGEILIHEGLCSNFFYFLYEGKCELQKRLKPEAGGSESSSPRMAKGGFQKQANICLLENGAFLGEEVLFQEDPVYQYSVRVTSARAMFFKFDKEDFQRVFGNPVVSLIEEEHNQKTGKNQEIFENISLQLHKRNNTKAFSPRFTDTQSPTHASKWEASSLNISLLNRKATFPSISYETEGPDFIWGSEPTQQDFSPTHRRLPQMLHSTVVPKESPRGTNGIVGFSSKGLNKISIKLTNISSPTNRTFKGERLSLDDFSPFKKSKLGLVTESSLTARRHNDRLCTLETTKEAKNSLNLMDDIIKSARFESKNLPYINKVNDHSPGISDISEISPTRKKKNIRFFSDLLKLSLDLGPLGSLEEDKDKKTSAFFQQSHLRNPRGANEFSPKETSPPPKSKSPQMRTPRIPLPLGQKIDLEGLKQHFHGTQKNGVKEYLATYKKAAIQNKMNRNLASTLQLTEGDCAVQMRLKPLPNFARKVSSPVIGAHEMLLQSQEKLKIKSGLSKLKGVGRKHVNLKPAQIDVKISR